MSELLQFQLGVPFLHLHLVVRQKYGHCFSFIHQYNQVMGIAITSFDIATKKCAMLVLHLKKVM